jgi:hypothetical protein
MLPPAMDVVIERSSRNLEAPLTPPSRTGCRPRELGQAPAARPQRAGPLSAATHAAGEEPYAPGHPSAVGAVADA